MSQKTFIPWLVIILPSLLCGFDVILDPSLVASLLAEIGRLHDQVEKSTSSEVQLEALYKMGEQVVDLTDLMNKDTESHGASDPSLVAIILQRLGKYGINVRVEGRGYKYDLAAFQEYLRRAPNGKHKADSRFALLANVDAPRDELGFKNAIAEKARFIHDFPQFPEMPMLKLLLAQDHLHLSRFYGAQEGKSPKNKLLRDEQLNIARKLYREIVRLYPDSLAGEAAASNLSTFGTTK